MHKLCHLSGVGFMCSSSNAALLLKNGEHGLQRCLPVAQRTGVCIERIPNFTISVQPGVCGVAVSLVAGCTADGISGKSPHGERLGGWSKVGKLYRKWRKARQGLMHQNGKDVGKMEDAFMAGESESEQQYWVKCPDSSVFLMGMLAGACVMYIGPLVATIMRSVTLHHYATSSLFTSLRGVLVHHQQRPLMLLACIAASLPAKPRSLALDVTPPDVVHMSWSFGHLSYMLDVLMERQPVAYVLFQMMACVFLITVGGLLFSYFRIRKQTLGDAMWDAWACVCSSGTHLKEKTRPERTIGLMLALGGLLFYSLLTSTLTAQFKSRMEWLREGAHSQVMESGHIVVCGANTHLTTILKQLNKSQEFAIEDGTATSRKQTVLILSERPRKDVERLVANVARECNQIHVLTRSGSLSSKGSFQKVAVDKAKSIILLANKDDKYESDADAVLSVLALQPLLEGSTGQVVAEVSRASTAELLKSLCSLNVSPVQDLSSKLFVQCSRQRGLVDVYRQLLDQSKQTINLRSYPQLTGIPFVELWQGFPEAVVCGLVRAGKVNFHPEDDEFLQDKDKLLVIAPRNSQREPPEALVNKAEQCRLESTTPDLTRRARAVNIRVSWPSPVQRAAKAPSKTAEWTADRKERIVMLGWRPGVGEMMLEYDDYVGHGSELVILAEASLEERTRDMHRKISKPLQNVHVTHKVGNPMSEADLREAILDASASTHNTETVPLSVVVIADTSWHVGDTSKPDKQSVFALLMAESVCKRHNVKVASLVAELVDTNLGKQVVKSHNSLTYIGTTELMGLVTAQVLEQSELNSVWTELLNSWGNEIYVKDIELYQRGEESSSFLDLSKKALAREEVAIGYRQDGKIVLNPAQKTQPLGLRSGDSLVVICEFEFEFESKLGRG